MSKTIGKVFSSAPVLSELSAIQQFEGKKLICPVPIRDYIIV